MSANKNRYNKYLKRLAKLRSGDKLMIAILGALILISILLFAFRNYRYRPEVLRAEVLQNGKVVQTIDLQRHGGEREILFENELGYNTVRIEGKKIRVVDADCPDQKCVSAGWLYRPGDNAVCLPHRFILRIRGYGAVDAVAF
ncbi:NusG domain II-containing protein [Synergistaceae bacterium OttesenSCG-928-D05]|nr:NusG domain II-containing protein [Synergistaceae bacterium OttesenSCG-928-D05]